MSATRFYFPTEGSTASSISPAFNASWNQTGQANRLQLLNKPQLSSLSAIATTANKTIPITTTQNILANQFVSGPIPPQRIDTSCLFSLVISTLAALAAGNATLATIVSVCSQDGGTIRGVLFSVLGTGSTFGTSRSTRIVSQTAVTALTTQPGDCLVIEIGVHAAAPTSATTYNFNQGNDNASDFALTASLATNINPWCEFSNPVYGTQMNNFEFIKAQSGISVTEKIR